MKLWLSELRGDRSQEYVAQGSGISQQMYCAIETGKRMPSVKTAKRIATVLGFPWTRFYEEPAAAPGKVGGEATCV